MKNARFYAMRAAACVMAAGLGVSLGNWRRGCQELDKAARWAKLAGHHRLAEYADDCSLWIELYEGPYTQSGSDWQSHKVALQQALLDIAFPLPDSYMEVAA